jgi:hypothetical protein
MERAGLRQGVCDECGTLYEGRTLPEACSWRRCRGRIDEVTVTVTNVEQAPSQESPRPIATREGGAS